MTFLVLAIFLKIKLKLNLEMLFFMTIGASATSSFMKSSQPRIILTCICTYDIQYPRVFTRSTHVLLITKAFKIQLLMPKLIVANLCQYLLKYFKRLLCADKDRGMVGNNSGTPKM